MVGLLARYFKGGFSIEYQMTLKWDDIRYWYNKYIYQSTEEQIVSELSTDSKGNKKQLPPYRKIRELTNKRIEEDRGKQNE